MALTPNLPGHAAAADIIAWNAAAEELKRVKAREIELRLALVAKLFPDAKVGTTTIDLGGGYRMSCEQTLNYKVDAAKGRIAEAALRKLGKVGQLLADRLLKWTPEIRVGEYKALSDDHKALFAEALTISPATPSLELKPPKDS